MKYLILFFSTLALILTACAQEPKLEIIQEELIFQSGFEPGSKVVARGSEADIIGIDSSFPDHNDWTTDFDKHSDVGSFSLQYQGGDSSQRFAKIISEPGNPENYILQFWLNEPNVEGKKGRIQANIYGGKNGLKEFYQSVRIFLPEDFNTVRTYPAKINWLTIAEFWNNITWSQSVPHRFRITLGIGKLTQEENDLYFILDAQDCELFSDGSQKYTTLWSEINENVKVPIGKWFTAEYYYREGDNNNGRYYMAIQPEGEEKTVIFDVNKITHNTADLAPNGVTDFNPLKIYTSKGLIDYMRSQGKTLQIYWDDFKLWKNKRPD
ncbi:MAG TPA: hypothetical protein VLA03_01455 [Draconibacterium sp.]|nr:hypothetical protein [Draconibacterium sp.]